LVHGRRFLHSSDPGVHRVMIAPPSVRGILATAVGVLLLVHGALATPRGAARSAPRRAGVSRATTAEPDTGARPDFSAYQTVLDDFVSVTSDSGAAIETRFDYW